MSIKQELLFITCKIMFMTPVLKSIGTDGCVLGNMLSGTQLATLLSSHISGQPQFVNLVGLDTNTTLHIQPPGSCTLDG